MQLNFWIIQQKTVFLLSKLGHHPMFLDFHQAKKGSIPKGIPNETRLVSLLSLECCQQKADSQKAKELGIPAKEETRDNLQTKNCWPKDDFGEGVAGRFFSENIYAIFFAIYHFDSFRVFFFDIMNLACLAILRRVYDSCSICKHIQTSKGTEISFSSSTDCLLTFVFFLHWRCVEYSGPIAFWDSCLHCLQCFGESECVTVMCSPVLCVLAV